MKATSAITNPYVDWCYDLISFPSIEVQVARVMASMVGLGPVSVGHAPAWQGEITDKADGIMALPSLLDLGKMLEIENPLGAGYDQLLEKVLGWLDKSRSGKFYNYCQGRLGSNYIRLHEDVRARREALENAIPATNQQIRFLLLPVSTRRHYQGYSPRNARTDAYELGNLPLDPVSVAFLLIAWPERQSEYLEMIIDCPGAEYSWRADGKWSISCYFGFYGSKLEFYADDADYSNDYCGTAVTFPGVSAA